MNRLSFEKELVEVQDLRRTTDHFRGIYGILPHIDTGIPEDVKPMMIMPKNLSVHWFSCRSIIIDEARRVEDESSVVVAKIMRLSSTNYRLLITGTPLQTNLHELFLSSGL
jgi:hypothetical protein